MNIESKFYNVNVSLHPGFCLSIILFLSLVSTFSLSLSLSLSLCYYSLHKCRHANWRNSICRVVLWWVGSRKPFLYSMEWKNWQIWLTILMKKNLIGETLFSKLYRGTIRHGWLPFEDWVVTVKIWDYTLRTSCYLNANESLMYICFLLN